MADKPMPSTVGFHYIKSHAFRVIHADGVVGGPTPNGHVHCSFFSERAAIPMLVEHTIEPLAENRARLGKEARREGKDGFVREVEIGVMMDQKMVITLHAWLTKQMKTLGLSAPSLGDADAPGEDA